MCYSAMVEQDIRVLETKFGAAAVRKSWEDFHHARQVEENMVPPLSGRIFPGYYAPVVAIENGQRAVRLMKYSVDPPEFVSDGKRFTTYNARRDNITSPFWGECFGRNHGLILLKSFYEWVAVKDLVRAGRVSLDQIKSEFEKQKAERKMRLKEAGKPYKPTKAELTEATFRKVVIGFNAMGGHDLLVPVVFSRKSSHTGEVRYGFAVVTDDPPLEVEAAGHDRCPVFLDSEAAGRWLKPEDAQDDFELSQLLKSRPSLVFEHSLAVA